MKRKDFGQHFLIDSSIIQNELWYAGLVKDDVVLEIGPGKGALTLPLAEKVRQVIALEKDPVLYDQLLQRIPQNVTLILADAVTYDFKLLPKYTKVVSNLPYKISSPITFKLLKHPCERAVLMYQKEFAERMMAKPGTKAYSRLTIGVYYYATCQLLKTVSRFSFFPPPRIDSCIVELMFRNKPAFMVRDESFFFELVTNLFNHRRKQIQSILKHDYGVVDTSLPFANKRVETLSPEQIGLLADYVHQSIKKQ